jgi:hemolysin activation/secretion protein
MTKARIEGCQMPRSFELKWTKLRSLGVFALAIATAGSVQAQVNIGTQLDQETAREIEALDDEANVRQEGPGVVTDPLNRRPLPAAGGATVLLRSVSFEPTSAFLSDAELDAIKANYLNRRVDFAALSTLVRDVNDLYAEKGVVTAAAILSPQDLSTGNLTVRLIEGQLGVVAVVGERLTSTEFITDRIRLTQGSTVDIPTASQDISYFNQTNRAQLRLLLQPGASLGLTDLVFGVTEPKPRTFQFDFDNNGPESTGVIGASLSFRSYGNLGMDDTLLVYLTGSEASRAGTIRFDLPVTTSGTRLAFSGTLSSYDVVGGPTVELDVTGASKSFSANLTQPVFADERWLIEATAGASRSQSETSAADVPVVDSETTRFSTGFRLSASRDSWRANMSAQAIFATYDDQILSTEQDYTILAGSLDGAYRFENGMSLLGRGAWQSAQDDLLPGDLLISIGGATTVRGYPADGVAGDSGIYANFELHKPFEIADQNFSGYALFDWGKVFSTFPAVTTLASIGVGASYSFEDYGRLDLSVAFPVVDAVSDQSEATLSATYSVIRH